MAKLNREEIINNALKVVTKAFGDDQNVKAIAILTASELIDQVRSYVISSMVAKRDALYDCNDYPIKKTIEWTCDVLITNLEF